LIRKERKIEGLVCSALFSECETYRYSLRWVWDERLPLMIVCMLNPSTATHEDLDPTISGLIKRAKNWDYGGILVVNLFAYRSPSPAVMKASADPIGPDNDLIIHRALVLAQESAQSLICGWGANGTFLDRHAWMLEAAQAHDVQLRAFKINANGTPVHPLYQKHDIVPAPWNVLHPGS
jgi:hypothetical protein